MGKSEIERATERAYDIINDDEQPKNIEWTEWNSEKYGMMGGLVQKPVTVPVVPSWSGF